MFDDESNQNEDPTERTFNPADQAREKSDEFRMHAELAAVFEGPRKFEAQLAPGLNADTIREIQRTMARLEKSKSPESPILPPQSVEDAAKLLNYPETQNLTTNDYHIHRRPGEVMIIRWLAAEQVETFYTRLQAHFDAAMDGFKEDERQANEWKKDPQTLAYLEELDKIEVKMADRHLRSLISQHKLFVLSTQTADEININYLADHLMGTNARELVGSASAPPDHPTDHDLAWFFKLFSLRGMHENTEQMCLFTYLQKSEDTFDLDE